jgi:diguanylate cyclase (GGDEF)-like protein
VRQHDLISRTGPDEFLIALRIDEGADILTTVNRIRRATVIKPFVTNAARHILGVTAGIAGVDPEESVDDLIARADQALVTGKARHRNRSYLASEPDTTWPQTGVALPGDDPLATPDRRAPLLEV